MTLRLRRDTAAAWTAANPTLAGGQPAYETDTKKLKFGDGVTPWNSLPYLDTGSGDANFHINQPGFFIDTSLTASFTTIAGVADRLQLHIWTPPRDTTADQIGVDAATAVAGTFAKVLAYDVATNGAPGNLLYESASIDCSAVGFKHDPAITHSFKGGTPYFMGVRNGGAPTLRAAGAASIRSLGRAAATGGSAGTITRSVPFANAAPAAWGAPVASEFVTTIASLVVMRLA